MTIGASSAASTGFHITSCLPAAYGPGFAVRLCPNDAEVARIRAEIVEQSKTQEKQ
jgi:hypothetical protein